MCWSRRRRNQQTDPAIAQLVTGVGEVTIAATSLEWALTYLTGLIDNWDDARFRGVFSSTGGPMREYSNLVDRFEKLYQSLPRFTPLFDDVRTLRDDARDVLAERNRVVHSVWMAEITADGQSLYEAWHARSDVTRRVLPEELNTLARALMACAAEATGFAEAWQERAERDGWPQLPAAG